MTEALARTLSVAACAAGAARAVCAALVAILVVPGAAWADDSAPVQDHAIPESGLVGGPSLLVVADLSVSETESAELRAALYGVARAHGYDPASKVDVAGVASRESLMEAGTVTDDPKALERLRIALGVAVLVRVSRTTDREGAVGRLTVVNGDGAQTRLLGSAAKAAVRQALDGLLPREDGSSRAPRSPLGLDEGTPMTDPSTAKLWAARGGLRPTYGAMAFASVTSLRHVGFQSRGPKGTGTVEGTATATGVGGGVGVRAGILFFPALEPGPTGTFYSLRAGIGFDTDFLYVRKPESYSYADTSRTTVYGSEALWLASLPIEVGGALALGSFTETSWHGAMIGLAYAPELEFAMDLSGTSGHFRFNPAGAMLSVDITSLDASHGDESTPQIRIAVWGLVPLDDAHPFILDLGIGALWY